MANPASIIDLASRWRPLSADEQIVGQTLLGDAWVILKRRLPTIEDDIAADTTGDLEADVVRVLAAATLRVLKNPDGYKQESIDDWSGTRHGAAATGTLFFTDEELSGLIPGGKGRAFSVDLMAGWTYGDE